MSDKVTPEIQALIDAALEPVLAKNKELLAEVKVFKAKARGNDIDPEKYAELQTRAEELQGQLDKATKAAKSETEKLTKALTEKEGALHNLLIDGGLTEALVKAGVKPELMPAAKAMLKGKAAIKADGGNYSALMGDKALPDAVKEWAAGDEGKHFVSAQANSGGGASGNGGSQAAKGSKRSGMSYEQKAAYIKENGQDAYMKLPA